MGFSREDEGKLRRARALVSCGGGEVEWPRRMDSDSQAWVVVRW